MRLRKCFVLVSLPLALTLAGCFQQAGTAMQEPLITNEAASAPDLSITSLPLPTDDTTTAGQTDGQSTNVPLPTDAINTVPDTTNTDGGNPPVALTIISATIAPAVTNTAASAPTTESQQLVDAQGTPIDTQFITPSGPLGPITQVPVVDATVQGVEGGSIPTSTPSGMVTPTAFTPPNADDACVHTVQSGDTLYRIALKYEVSLAELRQANPQVTGDIIQPGDTLNVPDCASDGSGDTAPQQPAAPTVIPTNLPAGSQTYVVQRGDTLYTIGIKFGVTMAAIQQANNLDDPDRLSLGQELIIPPKSG